MKTIKGETDFRGWVRQLDRIRTPTAETDVPMFMEIMQCMSEPSDLRWFRSCRRSGQLFIEFKLLNLELRISNEKAEYVFGGIVADHLRTPIAEPDNPDADWIT